MSKVGKLFRYGYGALDKLGFFSPTEKTIDLLGNVKGKPDQLLNQIKNVGGKAVEEESMFTGLDKFVDELPDKTTTTNELKNYLNENKTVINQTIKGGKLAGDVSRFQDANTIIRNFNDVEGDFYEDGQFQIRRLKPFQLSSYHRERLDFPDLPEGIPNVDFDPDAIFGTDEYFRIIDQQTGLVVDGNNKEGWFAYDNIDYANDNVDADLEELSDGVPVAGVPSLNEVDVQLSILEAGGEFRPEYGNFDLDGKYASQTVGRGNLNTNYREILLTNDSPFQKSKPDYEQEHFPEKNLIVHTRVNDKITEDGKKTLFLEEMQSDWSQRGEEGKNINYTPSEKKSLVNKDKVQMVKDLKNNYDKLNKISNIDDIKIYHQFDPLDSELASNQKRVMSYSYLNDDLDSQIQKLNIKKVQVRNTPQELAGLNKQIQLLEKMKTDDLTLGNLISNKGTKYKFTELLNDKKLMDITLNFDGKYNDYLYPSRVNEELINPLKKKVFFDLYKQMKGRGFDSGRGPYFAIDEIPDEDVNTLAKLYFGKDKEKIAKYFEIEERDRFGDPIEGANTSPTNLDDIDTDDKRAILFNIIRNADLSVRDLVPKHRKIVENFDVQPDKLEESYETLKKIEANLTGVYNFERKILGTHDIPSGPFINDTGAYTEIGLKNIIRNAIDEGYEKISISPGYIHKDRSNVERLVRYYDTDIPKALNKLIKGTDASLSKQRVFHTTSARDDFIEEFTKFGGNDPNSDTVKAFDLKNNLNERRLGDFFMDSITLEFTPSFIENVKSGQSLYTPIAATGLAGMLTANQIMGNEEDIITEQDIIMNEGI